MLSWKSVLEHAIQCRKFSVWKDADSWRHCMTCIRNHSISSLTQIHIRTEHFAFHRYWRGLWQLFWILATFSSSVTCLGCPWGWFLSSCEGLQWILANVLPNFVHGNPAHVHWRQTPSCHISMGSLLLSTNWCSISRQSTGNMAPRHCQMGEVPILSSWSQSDCQSAVHWALFPTMMIFLRPLPIDLEVYRFLASNLDHPVNWKLPSEWTWIPGLLHLGKTHKPLPQLTRQRPLACVELSTPRELIPGGALSPCQRNGAGFWASPLCASAVKKIFDVVNISNKT